MPKRVPTPETPIRMRSQAKSIHPKARNVWAFDTEDDSKGHVYWINFFNGDHHVSFDHPHRAVEWIYEQQGDFWAVNLEYDLINLFGPLLDQLCVLTYGGFGLLKASIYERPVRFLNTLRHWSMSVEEMGERLGHPKLPFDPTNLEYCKRDTEVTWFFVQEMLKRYEELGMKSVGATLPSTALKFYLEDYCHVAYQRHPDISQWQFLSRSRYGGRCEVFFTRPVTGRIWEYDIVSSYPAAMARERFPDLTTARECSVPDFGKEGVAHCTVSAPTMEFPLLPWKSPDSGKLLFPVGRFQGVWTYPEIRRALSLGYQVLKVHRAVEYESMPSPFYEYITYLYRRRHEVKQSDPLMAYTLKIAMNSTFGKFGEEGELQVISCGKRYTMRQIPKHSNMIWASYILAYGRLALYTYMMQATEKGRLLYVDTDSVFVRSSTKPFEDSKGELGDLAFKARYQYAHFKLPKLYRVDDSYKAKGVPLDKKAPKGEEQRLKKEFFYDGIAEFLKPYRWLEAKKIKEQANVWREVTKQLNATYDKRSVAKDGRTWPLEIGG